MKYCASIEPLAAVLDISPVQKLECNLQNVVAVESVRCYVSLEQNKGLPRHLFLVQAKS